MIGAGDVRFLAWAMVFAAAVFIPCAWLVLVYDGGIGWLWASLLLLMIVRMVTLGIPMVIRRVGGRRVPSTRALAESDQPTRAIRNGSCTSVATDHPKSASAGSSAPGGQLADAPGAGQGRRPYPAEVQRAEIGDGQLEVGLRAGPLAVATLARGHESIRPATSGRASSCTSITISPSVP